MFPVLFRWGDAALYAYPMLFSLAYFTALWIWLAEGARKGFSSEKIINLSLVALLVGLVGARGLYIATQWPAFRSGEHKIWALWEGGIVFFGGFLSALAYLFYAFPKQGIPRAAGFDAVAPAAAFAHAVGRLACFANGCCYGSHCEWPWAVTYRNPLSAARPLGVPLHPSQLYEVAGLCAIGWWLRHNNRQAHPRFATRYAYLFLYGCLRFAVEFTRGDPLRGEWLQLSTSQWISLGLILSALTLDSLSRKDHKLPHES